MVEPGDEVDRVAVPLGAEVTAGRRAADLAPARIDPHRGGAVVGRAAARVDQHRRPPGPGEDEVADSRVRRRRELGGDGSRSRGVRAYLVMPRARALAPVGERREEAGAERVGAGVGGRRSGG